MDLNDLHQKLDAIAIEQARLATRFEAVDEKLDAHIKEEEAHQARVRNGVAGVIFSSIGAVVLMVLHYFKSKLF